MGLGQAMSPDIIFLFSPCVSSFTWKGTQVGHSILLILRIVKLLDGPK